MNLAIITGTKKGLGKALTEVFRSGGWEVREVNLLKHEFCRPYGEITEHYNRVVYINNGFKMHIEKASELQPQLINKNILMNITDPIMLFSDLLRDFPKAEFVNITSGAAKRGIAHWSLYCTGKAAMEGYVRALEAEGVRCLNFEPGVINTDMQAKIRGSEFPDVEKFRNLKLRSPEDVAQELYDRLQ